MEIEKGRFFIIIQPYFSEEKKKVCSDFNLVYSQIFIPNSISVRKGGSMPKKVLIVDDEPSIVVSLQFLMNQCGFEVITATSGEEALETIMKFNPNLILLDVMLPGIDGYEVCEIVRLDPKWRKVKIIFLSAKGKEEDIAKGMVLGADEYITKPYSNAEVVEKVTKLLLE